MPTNAVQTASNVPHLQGLRNFRSLAGMPAADGARIAGHAVLRSDHLGNLTAQDWATLQALGLKTICDLRGLEERTKAPTLVPAGVDVRFVNFDIRNDVRNNPELARSVASDPTPRGMRELMLRIYRIFPDAFAPKLGQWFGVFRDQQAPALAHCAAGKDRTGFMVALLLRTLGVHPDDILADYLLSVPTDGLADPRIPGLQALFKDVAGLTLSPEAILPILEVEPVYLEVAMDEIARQHGSLDAYLQRCGGVDAAAVARLRDLYLA